MGNPFSGYYPKVRPLGVAKVPLDSDNKIGLRLMSGFDFDEKIGFLLNNNFDLKIMLIKIRQFSIKISPFSI